VKDQKRGIINGFEYSIHSLTSLKKQLLDITPTEKPKEMLWAVAGVVSGIVSALIKITDDVIGNDIKGGDPNLKYQICEIQSQFNEFLERMLDNV
jgi:hypothetical protein